MMQWYLLKATVSAPICEVNFLSDIFYMRPFSSLGRWLALIMSSALTADGGDNGHLQRSEDSKILGNGLCVV